MLDMLPDGNEKKFNSVVLDAMSDLTYLLKNT